MYVGYSPIIGVDSERILTDMPDAHVLHIVRNPWSAYADTKKRPVPLSLSTYTLGWTVNQYHALLCRERFPGRMHVIRIEDVLADPRATLGTLCRSLGLSTSEALGQPSWNGNVLGQVYPWGTIRTPTPEANRATAAELSVGEREDIRGRVWQYLDALDYRAFV